MNKILIVFAQVSEAEATLAATKATPIEGEIAYIWSEGTKPCCYKFDQGLIAISNVGLHSAQMCVAKYAPSCDEIWNFGMAGSLQENTLPIGEMLSIETVGKYIPLDANLDTKSQECIAFTIPHLFLEGTGSKLISSDFPIHDYAHRNRLRSNWDLVDMEGYGIAFAAAALGKKCVMWKIISDFASPGGRDLIRKHKAHLSEKVAQKILESL